MKEEQKIFSTKMGGVMFAVCYKLQFRVIVIYSSLFIVVIYVVFFWKLHQQHKASITDNHLQRSRSSSEHREERADAHRLQPAVTAAHVHYNRLEFFTDKASLPP